MARLNSRDKARRESRRRPAFESLARDRSLVVMGRGIMATIKETHSFPHV